MVFIFSLITLSIFSLIVSFLTIRLLLKSSVLSFPTHRCSHFNPTPTAGGFSIIIPFLLMFPILTTMSLDYVVTYTVSAIIISTIGFIDDYRGDVPYRIRIIIQIFCILLIMSTGLSIKISCESWFLEKLFTFLLLLFTINASNFCDGLNGFLSGNVIILLIFGCVISYRTEFFLIFLYLILCIIPFFIYNFFKGKIFLGDTGSTFIGLTLGFLALTFQNSYNYGYNFFHKGVVYFLATMSFLWFDVSFTLFHRILRKKNLTTPHREHLFHILKDKGYSHLKVSTIYFVFSTFAGLLVLFCHFNILSFYTAILFYILVQTLFIISIIADLKKSLMINQ